jgi:hypothetical protein
VVIGPAPAADFWTVAGSTAGVVAATAGVIALVHQLRSAKRRRTDSEEDSRSAETPATSVSSEAPLELRLSWMFPTYADGSIGPEGIGLTLINRLEHPVHWTSASIDLQDGSGRHMPLISSAPPGMGLPRRVESHSSDFTLVAAQQLRDGGLDLAHPITAKASLATGETVVSQPWTPGH